MFKIKNISYLIFFFFIIFFQTVLKSEESSIEILSNYLSELKHFKCNFIQLNPDGTVSEGNLIFSDNKIKISYLKPTKITFIAKRNKAMYYNETLQEVHYFNPDKTAFNIFKSLFQIKDMVKDDYIMKESNDVLKIIFNKFNIEELIEFTIFFERNPIVLKKFEWIDVSGKFTFSILDINGLVDVNKKTFNMANPLIKN